MNKQCPTVPLKQRLAFFTLILLIILLPVISLADADKIFKENSKAVVVVVTLDKEGNPLMQGSGFIVRADGAIVTNYHVISNAVDIKVKAGNKVLDVEGLIYTDKENDLVILKAKGEKLPTVKLGDIEKAGVGEKVYVISSPEGLENTISDGILSGIRELSPEKKVLQITAPVSQGSSGGPVFNKNGEVIGIATFIIDEAQNLNFAMPVDLIKNKIYKKTVIKDFKKEFPKKDILELRCDGTLYSYLSGFGVGSPNKSKYTRIIIIDFNKKLLSDISAHQTATLSIIGEKFSAELPSVHYPGKSELLNINRYTGRIFSFFISPDIFYHNVKEDEYVPKDKKTYMAFEGECKKTKRKF